jgi:hypothetical protein
MADNNYRSYRSRDPVLPGSAEEPAWAPQDDPLAELARLIGQSDPALAHDDAAPADGGDWAADDGYAGQNGVAEDHDDEGYEARHDPPPLADPYPQFRTAPAVQSRDYGLPAPPPPRFNGTRDVAPGYPVAQPRYRDEQALPASFDRQLAALPPRARDDRYQYDDPEYAGPDDAQYALEDYEDEAPSGRRRGGLVVVAAVLGLAVLGTAGAFAYRAMFGGSMLPSLPPIIRADDGPTKIMPNAGNAQASTAGQANASGGDRLVPREETPLALPQPASVAPNAPPSPAQSAAPSTAPRVVSTIPIFPDPTPGPPSGQMPSAAPASSAPWPAAPSNAPPPASPVPLAQRLPPDQPTVPNPESSAPVPAPSGVPGAKVIHTVPIWPDQMGGSAPSAAPPPPAAQTVPVPRPVIAQHPVKPTPAPAARADANAPLSIVPTQGDRTPVAPARVPPASARSATLASVGNAAPAAAGGGYAVQVSSQRSEADAQTEFRVLQAKFPNQLGGHQPIVRRADLGDKGVYYRAMVGPFASMDQAAQMCSSLKAAGGTCIVQKD